MLSGLLAACSGGGTRPADSGVDALVSAETCQGIRACLWGCNTGMQECVQTCINKGSPQAQALFQTLATCMAPYCPAGDFTCGCVHQCFDGNCLAETEACAAGTTPDLVCDELCH